MKVKEMFYLRGDNGYCGTGLYIVLENGDILKHQSTDSIMPFEKIEKLPTNQ